MDKQKYIDYLQGTSEKVSPLIKEVLRQYAVLNSKIYEGIMTFVKRRIGKPLLKPALLRASYELCGGEDWEKVIPACAAFELINISSYQANSAFDNKLGILTKKRKEMQFIAAMCAREAARECLGLMSSTFDADPLMKVAECLSVSNKYIYVAQHWDINLLTMQNRNRYTDPEYYLEEYTKRCFYGSGIFSGQCAYSGALLASASERILDGVKNFGEKYGTALHMINDLGDYVPTTKNGPAIRDYQDQFSDFRNGRLTLPLYYLLQEVKDEMQRQIYGYWETKESRFEELIWLTQVMLKLGVVDRIKEIISARMDNANAVLDSLLLTHGVGLFKAMTSVGKTNKYYKLLNITKQGAKL